MTRNRAIPTWSANQPYPNPVPTPRSGSQGHGESGDYEQRVLPRELRQEQAEPVPPLDQSGAEIALSEVDDWQLEAADLSPEQSDLRSRGEQTVEPDSEPRRRLGWLATWQFWGIATVVMSGGASFVAATSLFTIPAVADCPAIFLPLASASDRLSCARAAAEKGNVEGYLQAINLVKGLPANHPLRAEIDRSINDWALGILGLAEVTFNAGELSEAIKIARKIPETANVRQIVSTKIRAWKRTWEQGETIFRQAEVEITRGRWNQAFLVAARLLEVENDYWQTVKYQELTDRIILARNTSNRIGRASRIADRGGVQDLLDAIKLLEGIEKSSPLYSQARSRINEFGRRLLKLAEDQLESQDLSGALEIARKIPPSANLEDEVADFTLLAEAQSLAWQGSVTQLDAAIAQAQQIAPGRPLYGKAQRLIARWQLEIEAGGRIAQARELASSGDVADLTRAISQLQKIPSGSPRWEEAQDQIRQWRNQIETIEDRLILNNAQGLVISGNVSTLQAAIDQAERIAPGRALYAEAQQNIRDWRRQVEEIQDQPILDQALDFASQADLPSAIATAQRIGSGRALYPDAQRNIQAWQAQLRGRDGLNEARRLAGSGTPDSLASAIRVAYGVPQASSYYSEAVGLANSWSQQIMQMAEQAAVSDLRRAIAIAQQVPPRTEAYAQAQNRIQEWRQQLQSYQTPSPQPPAIIRTPPPSF